MNPNSLHQKFEELWSTFLGAYPGLTSLTDPRFVEDEIRYKRQAADEARSLLDAAEMRRLLDNQEFAGLSERVRKVCQKTNLLFLAAPRAGDCNILIESEDRTPDFWRQLWDLLHGGRPLLERFDAYVKFVDVAGLPSKWTFPTYLLFLLRPAEAMFIKPRRVSQFLQVVDPDFVLSAKPNAGQYGQLLGTFSALLEFLRPYGAMDFIDVQSFVWAWGAAASRQAEASREWHELIDRFRSEYLESETGKAHLQDYIQSQADAKRNWEKLQADRSAGKLDWKDVFRLTLPHRKTDQATKTGHWIHPDSFASGPVIQLLLGKGTVTESELPEKARVLLDFYEKALADPDALARASAEFEANPHSKGLQAGTVSPWLSALAPDHFLVGNSKSRKVISHFSRVPLEQGLTAYVRVNEEGLRLIDEHPELAKLAPGVLPSFIFDAFCHWMVAVEKYFQTNVPEVSTGWWVMKITPNDPSRTSDVCDALFGEGKPNIIGWESAKSDEGKNPLFRQWFDEEMDDGDQIIVMEGRQLVHAVVEVTGDAYVDEKADDVLWFRCRRPVRLVHRFRPPLKTKSKTSIWTLIPANRKELTTYQVAEQVKEELAAIAAGRVPHPPHNVLFGRRAFELLGLLDKTPTRDCYQEHREEFQRVLEDPLKSLFWEIADSLDDQMASQLETKKGLFSRIPKNDWGQGGAWPHIWAAFYPLGGKRISDAQLFLSLSAEGAEAGFSIGEYGKTPLDRMALNLSRMSPQIEKQIAERLAGKDLQFGTTDPSAARKDFLAWKGSGEELRPDVRVTISRKVAESMTLSDWREKLLRLFQDVWPLFLLATSDNPWPLIGFAMGEEEAAADLQPAYDLEMFEKETGVEQQRAEQWLGILDRKKQIILQGPPGTGKTYIAQRLAQHKTSETSGFWESVQFHPSYSYEDFMEGLRPCESPQGFTYRLFPGRFLEFCERATAAGGDPCVLILDELNRAPLSRVFGELMYALEYRDCPIRLAYSGRPFKIPENVYLIGTMNTADRSIALVDHALRRRFSFITLGVEYMILRKHLEANGVIDAAGFVGLLKGINDSIGEENFSVGISYFMKPGVDLKQHIAAIWQGEIEPYLDGLLFGQSKQVKYRWRDVGERMLAFF